MNTRELTMLQRRIDRTRKLAHGLQQAMHQLGEELDVIDGVLNEQRARQVPTSEGRVAKPRVNGADARNLHKLLDQFIAQL